MPALSEAPLLGKSPEDDLGRSPEEVAMAQDLDRVECEVSPRSRPAAEAPHGPARGGEGAIAGAPHGPAGGGEGAIAKTLCAACGDVGEQQCTACTLGVFYCGAACQKMHWPTHKIECKTNRPSKPISVAQVSQAAAQAGGDKGSAPARSMLGLVPPAGSSRLRKPVMVKRDAPSANSSVPKSPGLNRFGFNSSSSTGLVRGFSSERGLQSKAKTGTPSTQ